MVVSTAFFIATKSLCNSSGITSKPASRDHLKTGQL